MRHRIVLLGLPITLLLVVAAAPLRQGGVESWWPGTALLEQPAELLDIPALTDEAFLTRVRELSREVKATPTNRDNWRERIGEARKLYNALEAAGVLMPRLVLLGTNLLEGRSTDPDELFLTYASAVDAILGNAPQFLASRGSIGRVTTSPATDQPLRAREYTTIRLVYHVGKVPLPVGAKLRFSSDWYNDMGPMQFSRPLLPGYTTVQCSNPSVRLATGMEFWNAVWGSLYPPGLARPQVTVVEGTAAEGDTITITMGDRSGGGPGLLIQSTEIDVFPIRVELSPTGQPLSFLPVGEPHFRVHGAAASRIRVVAPTTVRRGESFTVRACVEDQYQNRAVDPPATLSLWLDGVKIAETPAVTGDPAIFHFAGVNAPGHSSGALTYTAKDPSGALWGSSNPVVTIGPDDPHVYWGELHGHEAYTDGSGTAEWYMRYARDIGFLDFVSLSFHDIMISELHLRDVLRATAKYDEPGHFVTFKGYEWTQDTRFGGHHNVYYRSAKQRIVPSYEAPAISDLYRIQREVNGPGNVLIIPHTHQPGDWNFNDAVMERLVEIYSSHGSFEWYGRRYLERGFHIGLITGGDDHTGHPGNTPAFTTNRAGNAAVLAPALTRDALFDALVARRAYGTTLARLFLDTRVAGVPMGGEVTIPTPDPPAIRVTGRVAGTAPIGRIVAVCNSRDSKVLDFLKPTAPPTASATPVVRVMIGSTSEPRDPDKVVPPLGNSMWQGRLLLTKARLNSVVPLGLEGQAESFVQVTERRVDFFTVTRGDEDGALLALSNWAGDGQLVVEVYGTEDVEPATRGLERSPRPLWGENWLRPDRHLAKRVAIPMASLLGGPQRHELDGQSWVTAELVAPDLPAYREFSFDVTENLRPDRENSVYLRVEQIDDHRAWSSPVWVTFSK